MDNIGVYAIYDSKGESYSNLLLFANEALAVRSFKDSVNNVESVMFNNPEDFTLFHVGTWDMGNGKLVGCDKSSVKNGVEVKLEVK